MKTLNSITQLAVVSLLGLVILHAVQIGAMLAQLELSPPIFVGPLLGSAMALQAITIPLILWQHKSRLLWVVAVVVTAIPSIGPQKFITEPDAVALAPMIILGTLFVMLLVAYIVAESRAKEKCNQKVAAAV